MVVGIVAQVAVQRLVGFVEKFVEAADAGIARVFGEPGLHLLVDGQVAWVHLAVGLVAQRADQHAAKGVQVQPHHDVGVLGGELDHRARFRCAAWVRASSGLLRLRCPEIREVAVEVVAVVAHEVGVGDAATVPVGNVAFGVELVEGAGVFGHARRHHRRLDYLAVLVAKLHQFTVRVFLAHVACEAVAIHVRRHPVRVALVDAVVHGAGAHVAALLEHGLGAVRRDARHHVEERVLQHLGHVRLEGLAAYRGGSGVQLDQVFGNGQGHAGAADL